MSGPNAGSGAGGAGAGGPGAGGGNHDGPATGGHSGGALPTRPAPPGSFQHLIERTYYERDAARGVPRTLLWFVEECGELVRAIRRQERQNLEEEFGDVYAWLATLASLHGIDLEAVGRRKYGAGCPRCRSVPCGCPHPPMA